MKKIMKSIMPSSSSSSTPSPTENPSNKPQNIVSPLVKSLNDHFVIDDYWIKPSSPLQDVIQDHIIRHVSIELCIQSNKKIDSYEHTLHLMGVIIDNYYGPSVLKP
jgi:hypothetical protein